MLQLATPLLTDATMEVHMMQEESRSHVPLSDDLHALDAELESKFAKAHLDFAAATHAHRLRNTLVSFTRAAELGSVRVLMQWAQNNIDAACWDRESVYSCDADEDAAAADADADAQQWDDDDGDDYGAEAGAE
jgi:hypothetical protein